jgi:NADP-dependent 3-hydroxy acid dehydrogenase YdfG
MEKKYVLITGATSGFGKACAQLFAKNNYNLILTGRRNDRLQALKNELSSMVSVETLCFDVRNEASVFEAIESLPENVKNQLSILINNAGLAVGRGPIDEGLFDDWD